MSIVGFRRENTQTNVDYWGDRCCKAEAENEPLRAALKEIQAYSVGDPKPRHTWYYDRAEAALNHQQNKNPEK